MWSIEAAKSLIKKGKKSNDELTKSLADYLGYALDSLNYYEKLLDEKESKK